MKLVDHSGGPFHLSYCLNVHPGESLAQMRNVISTHVPPIRQALSPHTPFGLGLRIADEAASELQDPAHLEALKHLIASGQTYAFTINGFPYGVFHGARVKEMVYAPDWRSEKRRTYTTRLIDILAELLPEGVEGSISTVPVSFKAWNLTDADVSGVSRHLMEVVAHAARVEREKGSCIHLGLEPEPCCFLETTEETLGFFDRVLFTEGRRTLADLAGVSMGEAEEWIRRHLGVCVDTCHVALQYEDPAEVLRQYKAAGIRVSKVQVSAALEVRPGPDLPSRLAPFEDEVYLHQVIAKGDDGDLKRWGDLPDFLASPRQELESARIHFHVPLHWEGDAVVGSTRGTMTAGFWDALQASDCEHVEVETYTFDVLPEDLRAASVEEDLIRECRWALDALALRCR